jgi:hypothetical protein
MVDSSEWIQVHVPMNVSHVIVCISIIRVAKSACIGIGTRRRVGQAFGELI